MVGGVLSMLTVVAVFAVFPAISVATPAIGWLAPSVVRVEGGAQFATPERTSVHENVAVTSPLFQPAAFGDGLRVGVIVGGVLSMLA
jgi:hypothetical protein